MRSTMASEAPATRNRLARSLAGIAASSLLAGAGPAVALNLMSLGDSLAEGLCAIGTSADCTDPYLVPANNSARSNYMTHPGFCTTFAEQMVETYNTGNAGGFRGTLLAKLTAAGIPVTYKGHANSGTYGSNNAHEGHGGWGARHIDFCVTGYLNTQHPDTVLLQVGTNDLIGTAPTADIANTIDSIRRKIVQHSPNARVLIASVPDKYSPSGVRDTQFESRRDDVAQRVADASGLDFPCTGGSLPDMGVLTASEMNLGTGAGFHPNTSGYNRMASIWASSLTTPECKFDTRTFVMLGGVLVESITGYGRFWLMGANSSYRESGYLNRPSWARYQTICAGKPVCTLDTRMFSDSPGGPQENITAFDKYYNYSMTGAHVSSGTLRSVSRYNQHICSLVASGCVFDTRALRANGAIETITAYGRYFDFRWSNGAFIASGALASVPRYRQICNHKPANQAHCTFDTRTYVQIPNFPYMESITAYGRFWNFDGNTGALLDSGLLADVGKYKRS